MCDPSLEACSLEADQAGCSIGPGLWLLATSIALVKKTGSSSDAPDPTGAPMVNPAKGFCVVSAVVRPSHWASCLPVPSSPFSVRPFDFFGEPISPLSTFLSTHDLQHATTSLLGDDVDQIKLPLKNWPIIFGCFIKSRLCARHRC
jgi:hypothetical protein